MKILWAKSDFLHPTTRGGQIRTLEMLRRLHRRHEVHYAAFAPADEPEALARSGEYCTRAYPVVRRLPPQGSARFAAQAVENLLSPLPLVSARYVSAEMRQLIGRLMDRQEFDSVVCDFIFPAPNIDCLERCVLFQHNVETMIWRRHAAAAAGALRRWYFERQAKRMFELERRVCRTAAHIVAVSAADAALMAELFGVTGVSEVPTGVDLDYFEPPSAREPAADLLFLGSMDWMPNVDAMRYFTAEVLPLIRRRRPSCSLAIVGRAPFPEIVDLAAADPRIRVTGTVPDVRPYLWGSTLSIVPLRVGGGTRLKIYESMAAGTPVVSTTIGAEGLEVSCPENIALADDPGTFAAACIDLLENADERARMAAAGRELVSSRFSWDRVTARFEAILERHSCRVRQER